MRYSRASEDKLRECDIDLQVLFSEVIDYYDCTIITGHRGKEDQDKAFAAGNSKLKYPFSKHNSTPSLAVDAAPYEANGIDWSEKQAKYFAGYVKATADRLYHTGLMKHRIRTGADWNNNNDIDDTTFMDPGHFELIPNK